MFIVDRATNNIVVSFDAPGFGVVRFDLNRHSAPRLTRWFAAVVAAEEASIAMYLFFDTETTGVPAGADNIHLVELAWVLARRRRQGRRQREFPREARGLHSSRRR